MGVDAITPPAGCAVGSHQGGIRALPWHDDASKFNRFLCTRRSLIGSAAAPIAWSLLGTDAVAAEPIKSKDTDSLLAMAKRKFRPRPPKVLRRKLSQDFAVLLIPEISIKALRKFARHSNLG